MAGQGEMCSHVGALHVLYWIEIYQRAHTLHIKREHMDSTKCYKRHPKFRSSTLRPRFDLTLQITNFCLVPFSVSNTDISC